MAHQREPVQKAAERKQREEDTQRGRDWADEAAQARSADDPRARAPHDATGRPSQGEPI
ncbi:hypothetical protein SAMN05443287_10683 [Micromonospora phaseoli]|uniref:Uncharacterized protein n=1 Tax=Micromonospora phaseoli TaxID=1144548 RepID=A0A1H7AEE1_9ACTN|nr:hypothetical protein [Micromonospora phaseoli]PZV96426.1 hypothetical protein CLV64_107305 [Micromonospora phaseoli]GIJ76114.1 hypothetical protein Xph01_05460 [Micromonospora phaseoli]SEJ64013.1 hypothetical protein SAMN05443287_10683 [Micromonospora phaseoli]